MRILPVLLALFSAPMLAQTQGVSPPPPMARLSQGTAQSLIESQPPIAAPESASGLVLVKMVVSSSGDVSQSIALQGPEELRPIAVEGVKSWRYRPYLLNGIPVEFETMASVVFGGGWGKRVTPPLPAPGAVAGVLLGSGVAGGISPAPQPPPPPADSHGMGQLSATAEIGATGQTVFPAPPADRPIRVSSGVIAALAMPQNPAPDCHYGAGVQGTVILHAYISPQGTVEGLQVISSPPALRECTVQAVKQWRYKPYLLNGQPHAVETTININMNFGRNQTAPQ